MPNLFGQLGLHGSKVLSSALVIYRSALDEVIMGESDEISLFVLELELLESPLALVDRLLAYAEHGVSILELFINKKCPSRLILGLHVILSR